MYEAAGPAPSGATWLAATWQETVTAGSHADGIHPDVSIDIVWDGVTLVVFGPRTRTEPTREVRPGAFVGVRLRPGSTRALLGEAAVALVDRTVPLEDLWGSGARDAAMRVATAGPTGVSRELRAVIIERGRVGPAPDRLVGRVVELADERRTVRDIAEEVGLSERQLFRRCIAEVGYGPKHLIRVTRLQRLLALARRLPDASLAALATSVGYSDQAHMSRECRALTGLTPGRLVLSQRRAQP